MDIPSLIANNNATPVIQQRAIVLLVTAINHATPSITFVARDLPWQGIMHISLVRNVTGRRAASRGSTRVARVAIRDGKPGHSITRQQVLPLTKSTPKWRARIAMSTAISWQNRHAPIAMKTKPIQRIGLGRWYNQRARMAWQMYRSCQRINRCLKVSRQC